jgi:hypothetical protein
MARRNRIQLFFAFMDLRQAALTGLPHLLYTVRLLLPELARPVSGSPAWEQPLHWLFALAILIGLAWGLRLDPLKPPRWVGSWAGYAFVLVLELILSSFVGSPTGTFGGLLWLLSYSAALLYLGRGDRMRAVLAVLPVAPVFIWSMSLEAIQAPSLAIGALLSAGLLMAGLSALSEGFIWGRQIFWTVVLATLLGGLPVAYASQLQGGGPGVPARMIGSLLGYLVAVGIFSWPAWLGGFWDWVKSKVTRGV